jgi:hypothetical protein
VYHSQRSLGRMVAMAGWSVLSLADRAKARGISLSQDTYEPTESDRAVLAMRWRDAMLKDFRYLESVLREHTNRVNKSRADNSSE